VGNEERRREAVRLFETTGRLTVDVVKAGPMHVEKASPYDSVSHFLGVPSGVQAKMSEARAILNKALDSAGVAKSTAVGGTAALETVARGEDGFIEVMVELLSRRSEEDRNRILQRISVGLRTPDAPHLNLTSGKWEGDATPVKKSFDQAYADLMRQHDVYKASSSLSRFQSGRWQ
jgi:hypothetical protein